MPTKSLNEKQTITPENPNPADIIDTFNEKLSYDKNGNIQSLVRNGGMESQTTVPVMDNLVYGYDTNDKNKLIKVNDRTANTDGFNDGADTTLEYGYDLNGNMTRDDNKGISSIIYNHLNLPRSRANPFAWHNIIAEVLKTHYKNTVIKTSKHRNVVEFL